MEARSYSTIGTTARANPVNNMEVLFPNGYDRNQNRERPLVLVRDTAAEEGDGYQEDEVLSSSPSENVTVTIKCSSGGDGIVTETDKKGMFIREEKVFAHQSRSPTPRVCSTEREHEKAGHDKSRSRTPVSHGRGSAQSPLRGPQLSRQSSNERDKSTAKTTIVYDLEDDNACHAVSDSATAISDPTSEAIDGAYGTTNLPVRSQDNLYEEYEKFVATSKSKETQSNEGGAKPKIRKSKVAVIDSKDTKETTQESFHREEHMSPVCRTPIVRENSDSGENDAEDFRSYLKQLRGNSCEENVDLDHADVDIHLPTPSTSEAVDIISDESLVDLTDLTFSSAGSPSENNGAHSLDVVTISDDEYCDANELPIDIEHGTIYEPDDAYVDSVIVGFNFETISTSNRPSVVTLEISSDSSDEDEENEDRKDDIQLKIDTDDDDGDNDSGNSNGGSGNSSGGSNASNDRYDDASSGDRDSSGSNDGDQDGGGRSPNGDGHSDDPGGSGGSQFSPGMRSRSSTCDNNILEDGCNLPVASAYAHDMELCEDSDGSLPTAEDQEVFEILDYTESLNKVECRFKTISAHMFSDSDCNSEERYTQASLGTSDIDPELLPQILSPPPGFADTMGDDPFVSEDTNQQGVCSELNLNSWNSEDMLNSLVFNGHSSGTESLTSAPTSFGNIEVMSMSEFSSNSLRSSPDYEQAFETALDVNECETNEIDSFEILNDINQVNSQKQEAFDDMGDTYKLVTKAKNTFNISEISTESLKMFNENEKADDMKIIPNTKKNKPQHPKSLKSVFFQNQKARTIVYFVPFLKEIVLPSINWKKLKSQKLVCQLRRFILREKRRESDDYTHGNEYTHTDVEAGISKELKSTLEDLKRKCTMCDTDEPVDENELDFPGRIRNIGVGFYIFGTGEKLNLPVGPQLKKSTDDNNISHGHSRYFRGRRC